MRGLLNWPRRIDQAERAFSVGSEFSPNSCRRALASAVVKPVTAPAGLGAPDRSTVDAIAASLPPLAVVHGRNAGKKKGPWNLFDGPTGLRLLHRCPALPPRSRGDRLFLFRCPAGPAERYFNTG